MFDVRVCVAVSRQAGVPLQWRRCAASVFAGIAMLEGSVASAAAVQSCLDDGGPTTLRSVVASAASNDTITLPDCKISLISGAIEIPQARLTLYGAKGGATEVSAQGLSRVFHHAGNDQLVLKYLTASNGAYNAPVARGGCIYSASRLNLFGGVTVHTCSVNAALTSAPGSGLAQGGAVFSAGDMAIHNSTVTGGRAYGQGQLAALRTIGGNVYSGGALDVKYSEISHGFASGVIHSVGGGIGTHSTGGVTMRGALLLQNNATFGGGFYIATANDTTAVTITNSVIASNSTQYDGAGLLFAHCTPTVSNSTVAFNLGGGIRTQVPMTLQSTIAFANANHPDFSADTALTIAGDHNLVGTVAQAMLPGDTLHDDPLLGPVGNYGGARQTVPLLRGSPAIDAGIDTNYRALVYDERGAGHSRNLGAAVDIGAFEFDPDPIFANGFEKLEN
jgi:fibronectin-binding autotransporter adhesin